MGGQSGINHGGGRGNGRYGGRGGGGGPTMNTAANCTRGTDECGAEMTKAVRGGRGAGGAIGANGMSGGEGTTAAILEGVPRVEAN